MGLMQGHSSGSHYLFLLVFLFFKPSGKLFYKFLLSLGLHLLLPGGAQRLVSNHG